jgi:alpha-tubulin suppressor-like RCC1 family protein
MAGKYLLITAVIILLVGQVASDGGTARARTTPRPEKAAAASLAPSNQLTGQSIGLKSIATGNGHTCVLMAGGGVKCWGDNFYGQLGDGSRIRQLRPVDVSGLTGGVTALQAGNNHTCALMAGGGVKCWGYNSAGQLGDGTKNDGYAPVDVGDLSSGVTALAAGDRHTCALTASGGVKCWGLNLWGQLGDGTTVEHLTPVDVLTLTSGVTAVAAGSLYNCALMTAGGVKCWGDNTHGQLGIGTTQLRLSPVEVSGLSGGVTALAAGEHHTCALMEGGGVKCWGLNDLGQLGDGTSETRLTPVDVSGLESEVIALAAGSRHTCALTTSAGVKCWGDNSSGQLGDGTTTNRSTPVDVSGLTSAVTVLAAGSYHTCVITANAGASCWGSNYAGQLGNWTTIDSSTPVDVFFPSYIYLPLALHNLCPDFLDDFSNPRSGWETGEDEAGLAEYLNGEYRVLVKPAGAAYAFAAPTFKHQDYIVEVDARWGGNSGASYGLIFGLVGDYEQFYSFLVNSDSQSLSLYRYDASGWSPQGGQGSPLINAGTATNHLKVTRQGNSITLGINGQDIRTEVDGRFPDYTGVGLIVISYSDLPNADARFDNFKVSCLTPEGPAAMTNAPAPPASTTPDLIQVDGAPDQPSVQTWRRWLPGRIGWR